MALHIADGLAGRERVSHPDPIAYLAAQPPGTRQALLTAAQRVALYIAVELTVAGYPTPKKIWPPGRE
jgi:hypothetical protein